MNVCETSVALQKYNNFEEKKYEKIFEICEGLINNERSVIIGQLFMKNKDILNYLFIFVLQMSAYFLNLMLALSQHRTESGPSAIKPHCHITKHHSISSLANMLQKK